MKQFENAKLPSDDEDREEEDWAIFSRHHSRRSWYNNDHRHHEGIFTIDRLNHTSGCGSKKIISRRMALETFAF